MVHWEEDSSTGLILLHRGKLTFLYMAVRNFEGTTVFITGFRMEFIGNMIKLTITSMSCGRGMDRRENSPTTVTDRQATRLVNIISPSRVITFCEQLLDFIMLEEAKIFLIMAAYITVSTVKSVKLKQM